METERTLLLVDDDADIGAALNRLLRQEGYKILCARSGREGLELLARNEVHVIVSDQRMPEMTGVEFLSRVKDLYPKTVRIILSGYADLSSVTDAINRGAIYKFLTKPWDNETLCANVMEAFRHFELTQQRYNLAVEIQESNTTLATLSLELSKLLAQKDIQIERISNIDQLTGLPNRAWFLERLRHALEQIQLNNQSLAVLLIDVDHFREINDSFGNAAGDIVLQEVSALLTSISGENDALARMGSNEFGLLLTGSQSQEAAAKIAQKILDSFICDQISADGCKTNIFTSIGISTCPPATPDTDTLIRNASSALRTAKKKGHHYVLHSAN
jgi:diguanylate cyclase (GGDEF)-like protein